MNKENTCCFSGHRNIPPERKGAIYLRLKQEIEALIKTGVTDFKAGGALGFDMMATQIVLSLKSFYPQIRLFLLLPCPDHSRKWSEAAKRAFNAIKQKADCLIYTSDSYFRGCMFVRNRALVDGSSFCIYYLTSHKGGTAFTVGYAKKKGLSVVNVAETLPVLL